MTSQFDNWLRQLAAARKGPVILPGCTRGRAYATTVSLNGDWSGAAMRAQLRLYPDAPGDPLATFTISGPDVGEGITTFTLSLGAGSDMDDTGSLPPDDDLDGVETFAVDVLLTPDGGDEQLLFGGVLPLLGSVTQ